MMSVNQKRRRKAQVAKAPELRSRKFRSAWYSLVKVERTSRQFGSRHQQVVLQQLCIVVFLGAITLLLLMSRDQMVQFHNSPQT